MSDPKRPISDEELAKAAGGAARPKPQKDRNETQQEIEERMRLAAGGHAQQSKRLDRNETREEIEARLRAAAGGVAQSAKPGRKADDPNRTELNKQNDR